MPTIVYSTEDTAGKNIAGKLVEEHSFRQLPKIKENQLVLRNWEKNEVKLLEVSSRLSNSSEYLSQLPCLKTELIVFASRHRSETGMPCLTVHAAGNWSKESKWGGNPCELAVTSAKAIASAFRFLKSSPLQGFETFLEGTHHGPTSLHSPSLFIEIGSTEKEWVNEEAARKIAEAIMHACSNWRREEGKIALGFGGTHYCSKFLKPEEKEYCFSHIAPKHVLNEVNASLVKQAISKTSERIELACIDWKGTLQEQRQKLLKAFEENNLEWVRL